MATTRNEILVDFYNALKDANYYEGLLRKLRSRNPKMNLPTHAEDMKLKTQSEKKAMAVLRQHNLFLPTNK